MIGHNGSESIDLAVLGSPPTTENQLKAGVQDVREEGQSVKRGYLTHTISHSLLVL